MKPLDAATVIREHAAFVWRVLRHHGVAQDQLEDLSQEVFLIVVRQLAGFEGRSSLRTWIFGICRLVAQRARARAPRHLTTDLAELPELSEPAAQDRDLWLKQAHEHLVRALDTLDADQRAVFLLYEIEELPMEEIASAIETPLTTCYSRLATARRKLESVLRRRQHAPLQMIKGGVR